MSPNRKIALAILALAILIGLVAPMVVKYRQNVRNRTEFRGICQYVAVFGQKGHVPASVLKHFGLPVDDGAAEFITIGIPLDGMDVDTRAKLLCIRERGATTDVILGEKYVDKDHLYHCTVEGTLINAAVIDAQPRPMSDPHTAFSAEVRFWRDWWDNLDDS